MRAPELPRHYRRPRRRLHPRRCRSRARGRRTRRGTASHPLVVGLLLARRRLHAARDQVDRAVRAVVGFDLVVGVAGDRVGAGDGAGSALIVSRVEIRRPLVVGAALLAFWRELLLPRRPHLVRQPRRESLFYGALVFSPVFCAGLLFSSSYQALFLDRRAISAPICSARWSAASASTSRCSPATSSCWSSSRDVIFWRLPCRESRIADRELIADCGLRHSE